jgi:NAD(P)-dependent dehydrogenase (short-subunit alcohol dehydrogenase family)
MTRQTVLITGAASGIGRAAAIRFANEGYDVLAIDLQEQKLQQLKVELAQGSHEVLCGSIADENTINKAKKLITQKWNRLDVLVNCAGLFRKSDPVTMNIAEWRETFDIMINGCLMTSRLATEFMHKGGRMIHITSIHGERGEQGASAYAMAKSAINQFCRAMAIELAYRNILVNAIAPGFVNTPMSIVNGQNELEGEWFRKNYVEGHHLPLRRAAEPEEIAGVAFFLAGKDSSYITGQVITVDGGLTITF